MIIFGRVASQNKAIKRYLVFPPHQSSASTLPGERQKHKNCIFSLKSCIKCIAKLQPVAGLIYSVLLLATCTYAAVLLPKSCSQWN